MKGWILAFIFLATIVGLQLRYDAAASNFKQETARVALEAADPLIPTVPVLRFLSLGNPSLVADILWLQSIQYFGSGNPYGDYPALGPMLDTVTQLDPKFSYPYQFGMIILPYMNNTPMALELGERAQNNFNDGLLTFYLASDYHINAKDYRKAAFYYEKASTQPNAPTAAKQLAGVSLASLSGSLNDRLAALNFWKTVFETSTNEDEKDRAAGWYQHMQVVYSVEKAAQTFHEQTGRFPNSQDELVKAKLLPSVLSSPIGRTLTLSPETGIVSF